MAAVFYVYQHRRADTGAVFYVGKGTLKRSASRHSRNAHWRNTVAKCGGFASEIVATCESEELAYLAEYELISKLKFLGVKLTNMAAGGEGGQTGNPSPFKGQRRPAISLAMTGVPKSQSHRAALSATRKGVLASEDTRAKMSATRKGRPSSMLGKTHRDESKAKIGAAQKGDKNYWFGKPLPDHVKAASIAACTGRGDSEAVRRKKSESHLGEKNHWFGKPVSEERKAKQRATLMANLKVNCPHCGKLCDKANATRWHFDNCKRRV